MRFECEAYAAAVALIDDALGMFYHVTKRVVRRTSTAVFFYTGDDGGPEISFSARARILNRGVTFSD